MESFVVIEGDQQLKVKLLKTLKVKLPNYQPNYPQLKVKLPKAKGKTTHNERVNYPQLKVKLTTAIG